MKIILCLVMLFSTSVCYAGSKSSKKETKAQASKKEIVLQDRYGRKEGTIKGNKFTDRYGRTQGTDKTDRYGKRSSTKKEAIRSEYKTKDGKVSGRSRKEKGSVVQTDKNGRREGTIKKGGSSTDRYGRKSGSRSKE